MSRGAFSLSIAKFIEKTEENAEIVVRSAVFQLLGGILALSPVDTGRFRGNWQVGIESSPTNELPDLDKTGESARARGQAVLASFNAGETIFLANNLPYSVVLEYGRDDGSPGSVQAPQGVVGIAIVQFNQYLERAVAALPNK